MGAFVIWFSLVGKRKPKLGLWKIRIESYSGYKGITPSYWVVEKNSVNAVNQSFTCVNDHVNTVNGQSFLKSLNLGEDIKLKDLLTLSY